MFRSAIQGIARAYDVRPRVVTFGTIAIVAFLAHYSKSHNFLLYEDDWFFISRVNLEGFFAPVGEFLTGWPQGRPLGFSIAHIMALVFSVTGSIYMIYLMGWVLLSVCGSIAYIILRAAGLPAWIALASGIVFIVFPADLTKNYITHIMFILPSATFVLLSAHCFLKSRIYTGTILLFLSLITYETVSLAIFVWIIFIWVSGYFNFRKLAIASVAAVATFLVYGALRVFVFGEARATGAGLDPSVILTSSLQGLRWLWATLREQTGYLIHYRLSLSEAALVTLAAVAAAGVIHTMRSGARESSKSHVGRQTVSLWIMVALFLACLLGTLSFAFFFAGSWPTAGRATRLYAGLQLASPALFAWIFIMLDKVGLCRLMSVGRRPSVGLAVFALFVAWGASVGITVQNQMLRSASVQRAFFAEIDRYLPHFQRDDVVVIVDRHSHKDRGYLSFTWGLAFAMYEIYGQANAPRYFAYLQDGDHLEMVQSVGEDYRLVAVEGVQNTGVDPGNVLFLEWSGCSLSPLPNPFREGMADWTDRAPVRRPVLTDIPIAQVCGLACTDPGALQSGP